MPRIDQILIDTLLKLVTQFTNFIPKLIGGIVVFMVGLLIAKAISAIIVKVFQKVGIDKLGEKLNELDFIKKFKIEIVLSTIISKIVYFFIMLIFISTATETLGFKVITDLVASMVNMVPKLIAAMIMLIIGLLMADAIQKTVVSACKSLNISAGKMIGSIIFFFFLAITVIAALGQAGINTTLLESSFNLIIAGIIFAFSFGYGMASKDILANMLSSFYSKNKYKEGQVIELDGIKGTITSIDQTSIVVKTGETSTVFPLNILQTKNVILFDEIKGQV
jgi:small-conductance mechanosensitive channel